MKYSRAQFVYDGPGRSVKRTIDGATTVITYDNWKPIMEWSSPTQLAAWNAYGPGADEILWRWQSGKGRFRYHSDRHGNVTALLDFSGNVVERYRYDAFGKPTILSPNNTELAASAYGNRFLFQGREYFREIGLYDYRHRFYDPFIGRFIQTDPTGLQTEGEKLTARQKALFSPGGVAPEAFSSSEMNLFRYCHNDPVNKSDPMGLDPGDPFSSAVDAVRDLHSFINPTSIRQNVEYGSTIYKLDGKYFATTPARGAADHSYARNPTPDGAKTVGDYHTHGDYSYKDPKTGEITRAAAPGHGLTGAKHDNQNSDHASPKDKAFYQQQAAGKPEYKGYLGTPSGRLLGIDPNDKLKEKEIGR